MSNTQVDTTAGGFISVPDSAAASTPVSAPYTVTETAVPQVGAIGGGYDPNNPNYGNPNSPVNSDVSVTEGYTNAPNFSPDSNGYDPNTVETTGGGYDATQAGLADPSNARLGASGLNFGGGIGAPAVAPSIAFQSVSGATGAATSSSNDWRVRVSLADGAQIFYKDPTGSNSLMAPLIQTNGVIFPYTPSISIQHAAHYSPITPTHSNYPIPFYQNSEVSDISISGDFTVQSIDEGQYLMAVIYFFRSATKMFFGQGTNVGNPPPMVFLDGYGDHYFPHVPCVITAFQHTLADDVDYIEVPISSTTLQNVNVNYNDLNINNSLTTPNAQQFGPQPQFPGSPTQFQTIATTTRLPTKSQISITLKPVYSRLGLHERFDLNQFAAGALLQDRNKGYGGFL